MATAEQGDAARRPVPGRLFHWVKLASWFELGLFTALLFFWIAPGYPTETALFGLLHGIGYLGLCALIFWAIMRREAPWPLLAATLTPLGPVGAVIGIELIERRGWGIGPRELTPQDQTGNNQRRREDVLT
ncbi:MAG TPA: hypothetical protein VFY30_12640 [Solirubrobacterales bacterium]|nr:hypothetical protein [Solirubrobacterales bacterium]